MPRRILSCVELFDVALAGGVDVLGFGDEAHVFAAGDAGLGEDSFVRLEVLAVDDEQLVLVELHFLRDAAGSGRRCRCSRR